MLDYFRGMIHERVFTGAMVACYLLLGIMIGSTLYAAGYYADGSARALPFYNLAVLGMALFILIGLPRLIRKPRRKGKRTRMARAMSEEWATESGIVSGAALQAMRDSSRH